MKHARSRSPHTPAQRLARWIVGAGLLVPVLAAATTGAAPAGETPPGIQIRATGQDVAVVTAGADPVELAATIARHAGIRLDGIERLQGTQPVKIELSDPVPAPVLLGLLAQTAGVALTRSGPMHYAYTGPEQAAQHDALQSALAAARESGDEDAIVRAETALLDFIRPPPTGPVWLDAAPWFEAADRAELRDDLERTEALLRDAVAHLERRDDATGADYGIALGRLGRVRMKRGDADAAAMIERGLALASTELGTTHVRLAQLQDTLAREHEAHGRFAEAERLFQQAIEGYAAGDDLDRYWLALSLEGLAQVYVQQQKLAQAEPLLRRSYDLHRDLFGDDGAGFQAWQLSQVLVRQDKLSQAAPVLRHAIATDAPQIGHLRTQLAAIERLGALADETPDAGALAALRATLAEPVEPDVLFVMSILLQARAERQYREAPDADAWRTSCAAFADIELTRHDTTGPVADRMRDSLVASCVRSTTTQAGEGASSSGPAAP